MQVDLAIASVRRAYAKNDEAKAELAASIPEASVAELFFQNHFNGRVDEEPNTNTVPGDVPQFNIDNAIQANERVS